jgi:hypothetical protein
MPTMLLIIWLWVRLCLVSPVALSLAKKKARTNCWQQPTSTGTQIRLHQLSRLVESMIFAGVNLLKGEHLGGLNSNPMRRYFHHCFCKFD